MEDIFLFGLAISILLSVFFRLFGFSDHFFFLPAQDLSFSALVLDEDVFGHGSASVQSAKVNVFQIVLVEDGLSLALSSELDIDVIAFSDHKMERVLKLVGLVRVADHLNVHRLIRLQQAVLLDRFEDRLLRFFLGEHVEIRLDLRFVPDGDLPDGVV